MVLALFRVSPFSFHAAPRQPGLGPSDSSDSGSDLPGTAGEHDTDSQGTGERESVEPSLEDDTGTDIEADRVVDEDEAGLAHSRPDPVRNGGKPD
ncbi:MatE family transporter [Bordetella sp. BOR01]|uniref:MatE family transporter n=1 Tax=Bordetella sp. BOR01 TaxID=2854779 RepID=UPI001C4757E2|nr:MatE family transporter [Bordetella sp. BOR01]MBV7486145.1 MatE family transporter [Bordetella sp. BOR01]